MKLKSDGFLDRYNAHLVALEGYGIDYHETFAQFAKMIFVCTAIALVAS